MNRSTARRNKREYKADCQDQADYEGADIIQAGSAYQLSKAMLLQARNRAEKPLQRWLWVFERADRVFKRKEVINKCILSNKCPVIAKALFLSNGIFSRFIISQFQAASERSRKIEARMSQSGTTRIGRD